MNESEGDILNDCITKMLQHHKSIEEISFSRAKDKPEVFTIKMTGSTKTDHGSVSAEVSNNDVPLYAMTSDANFRLIMELLWAQLVDEFNKEESNDTNYEQNNSIFKKDKYDMPVGLCKICAHCEYNAKDYKYYCALEPRKDAECVYKISDAFSAMLCFCGETGDILKRIFDQPNSSEMERDRRRSKFQDMTLCDADLFEPMKKFND